LSDDPTDPFLSRWSRRKVAARRGEALLEPVAPSAPPAPAPAQAPAPAAEESPPELPSIDTLKGLESDYKAFMQPDVDPAMRTAAMKKLFSDPHFNTMDRLDVYIDDYSIPDPIPAAMLKTLSAARTLGLFQDEEKVPRQGEAAPEPDAVPAGALPPSDTAPASDLPDAAASEPEPASPRAKRDA
jgi:hypothetical protein